MSIISLFSRIYFISPEKENNLFNNLVLYKSVRNDLLLEKYERKSSVKSTMLVFQDWVSPRWASLTWVCIYWNSDVQKEKKEAYIEILI